MEQREKALARRHPQQEKDLSRHTKVLAPLTVGQVVLVQNQRGSNQLRWNKSGQVVEVLPFDQYRIKMDGTGRPTLRSRKFLRAISTFSRSAADPSPTVPNNEDNQTDDDIAPTVVGTEETINVDSSIRRSARTSKPPVRLEMSSFSCSRSSQGEEHR